MNKYDARLKAAAGWTRRRENIIGGRKWRKLNIEKVERHLEREQTEGKRRW